MLSEGFIKLRKATFDDYLGKFEFSYRDRSHYSVCRLLRILCRSEAEFGEPLANPSEVKPAPQVALIIETSVIYGRRILAGVARYLRTHHRWSVFIEQHELGTPPPAWLTSGHWDGILSRPTDHVMARLFRQMKVPVVDLNDLYENLDLPWVGSDHAAIGRMGAAHLLERGFRSLRSVDLLMSSGPGSASTDFVRAFRATMAPFPSMKPHGAVKTCHGGTRIFSKL
jgi:hypothetical protein